MDMAHACPRCGGTTTVESSPGPCPFCDTRMEWTSVEAPILSAGSFWFDDKPAVLTPTNTSPSGRGEQAWAPGVQELGSPVPFGDYALVRELGRGGMGVVYEATQVSLKRTVALKMILSGRLTSHPDARR